MRPANAILVLCGLASLGLVLWLAEAGGSSPAAAVGAPVPKEPALATAAEAPEEPAGTEIPHWRATNPAEVRRVVKFCRKAGPESLASLRDAALRSPDPLVAGNALRALGRLGAVIDDPELVRLIEDPRQRLRQEAVLALGRSRSQAAVQHLAPLLEWDDPVLRPLVLQALASLGGERSREILRSVLDDDRSSATERLIARKGLEQG